MSRVRMLAGKPPATIYTNAQRFRRETPAQTGFAKHRDRTAPQADLVAGLPDANRRKCPACAKPMIVKRTKSQRVFWSCPRYPRCKGSATINQQRFAAWQKAALTE